MNEFKVDREKFNKEQLKVIDTAYANGYSDIDLRYITRLNKDGKPYFKENEMRAIYFNAYEHDFSEEWLSVITLTDEYKPVFNQLEINSIITYMYDASDKQIDQLIDIIDQDPNNKSFLYYLDPDISPECMRMLNSLSKMGRNWEEINTLAKLCLKYEVLKDVKYYLSLEEYFNYTDKVILQNFGYYEIKQLTNSIADTLCNEKDITDLKKRAVINRCVEYRMKPEELVRIMIGHTANSMTAIAAAFLNGLTPEDVDAVMLDLAKNGTDIKDFNYHFNEKIKEKIAGAFAQEDYEEILTALEESSASSTEELFDEIIL